jgi:hypothetical protein
MGLPSWPVVGMLPSDPYCVLTTDLVPQNQYYANSSVFAKICTISVLAEAWWFLCGATKSVLCGFKYFLQNPHNIDFRRRTTK